MEYILRISPAVLCFSDTQNTIDTFMLESQI